MAGAPPEDADEPMKAVRTDDEPEVALTPHRPTASIRRSGSASLAAAPDHRAISHASTANSVRRPSKPSEFSLRFHVVSEPPRLYDALRDEHCASFVRTQHFEKHWRTMNAANGRLHKIDAVVEEATKAKDRLLHLPSVMRHPVETLKKQFDGAIQSRAKEEPAPMIKNFRIPYITEHETTEIVERFLHKECNPCVSAQELVAERRSPSPVSPQSDTPHDRRNSPRPLCEDKDADGRQSPHGGTKRVEVFPSRKPVTIGFLTDQYLSILVKSEDYARRQDYALEEQKRSSHLRAFNTKLNFFKERFQHHLRLFSDEIRNRDDIQSEQDGAWEKVCVSAAKDRTTAVAKEEIFPSCDVLKVNAIRALDSSAFAGCVADLRWTGSPEYCALYVLAFDGNNKFVTVCGPGESLRCSESGNTILRSWGETRFGGTRSRRDQDQGQRATFEIIVSNFSTTNMIRRFVFCVMNGKRTGAPLLDLQRAYFTLRVPEGAGRRPIKLQSDTKMKEFVAVELPSNIAESAVAIASFVWAPDASQPSGGLKRIKSVQRMQSQRNLMQANWAMHLHAHLRLLPNVLSYLRLPPMLEATVLITEGSIHAAYWAGYFRICRQEDEAAEKNLRFGISLNETAVFSLLMEDESAQATMAQNAASSMYLKRSTLLGMSLAQSKPPPAEPYNSGRARSKIITIGALSRSSRRRSSSPRVVGSRGLSMHAKTEVSIALESSLSGDQPPSPAKRKLSSSRQSDSAVLQNRKSVTGSTQ